MAGALRRKIATGEWEAHHQLTAEPALAQDLGVSRGLRKALDILITEGLLRRVHGRGTFVLPRNAAAPFGTELSTVYEELVKRGVHFSTTVPARSASCPHPPRSPTSSASRPGRRCCDSNASAPTTSDPSPTS